MHEDKIQLTHSQIGALAAAVAERKPDNIYFVACGGSLATLYPGKYLIERLSDKASTGAYSANEFFHDPPKRLGKKSFVVLNSQSGSTAETVASAKLAHERGALTAAFTTTPDSALEKAVDYVIYYYDNPVNPYPKILSIFPEVYMTVFSILDALDGTKLLPDMITAMEKFEAVSDAACELERQKARKFGGEMLGEPLIYTVSAGLDYCIGYVLTNCAFMESIWIDSNPIHAGEFFHGAFEAVDKDTPVFAFLGLGRCRPVEERAVHFLQRITNKLTVIDAAAYDLSELPEWTREYVAPLVLNCAASAYCNELSARMGHPMSSRRYMGVEKY